MKRLRIFPEMCARTRRSFASATRNMVPGRTIVMVPSSSMAFSEFTMRMFLGGGDGKPGSCFASVTGPQSPSVFHPGSTSACRQTELLLAHLPNDQELTRLYAFG